MSFREELTAKFLDATVPSIMVWAIDTIIGYWKEILILLGLLYLKIKWRELWDKINYRY